jgi:hypothetical protein
MDRLTAIRTFGSSSFTPAKRTKIFADRWYLVTFQNVETDPMIDYVGLGEGEYSQLLPGNKARESRDAKLNHCNAIVEYTGPVYAAYTTSYGTMREAPMYFGDVDALHTHIASRKAEHDKWISDCQQELARLQSEQDLKYQGWRESAIRDCTRVIAERKDGFAYRVEKER